MKYKDWLNEWLAVCVKPTAKARTYEKYERVCRLRLIPALGDHGLKDLNLTILQRFIADMVPSFSPNTVNSVISVLKISLKKAVLCGAAEREFTDGISRPKTLEKRVECFAKEEQKLLEDAAFRSKKQKLVGVVVCLYTGLRIGELLSLTWDDINFSDGTLSVTKSCHDGWGEGGYRQIVECPKTVSSFRLIPIPRRLLVLLKSVRRASKGNFVIGGKKPVSVRSYQRTFELLQKKLHLPHRGFHALRHTFATRAIECGMDVKTLSELLGHKSPTVTLNRYVHSLMEHKRMMMDRLGKFLQ